MSSSIEVEKLESLPLQVRLALAARSLRIVQPLYMAGERPVYTYSLLETAIQSVEVAADASFHSYSRDRLNLIHEELNNSRYSTNKISFRIWDAALLAVSLAIEAYSLLIKQEEFQWTLLDQERFRGCVQYCLDAAEMAGEEVQRDVEMQLTKDIKTVRNQVQHNEWSTTKPFSRHNFTEMWEAGTPKWVEEGIARKMVAFGQTDIEPDEAGSEISSNRIVVAWDPQAISPEEYARIITLVGDLARASGAKGLIRIRTNGQQCEIPAGVLL